MNRTPTCARPGVNEPAGPVGPQWHRKALGKGLESELPYLLMQEAVAGAIRAMAALTPLDPASALFSRYDAETNVLTVWFSPQLSGLADAFAAHPCGKPQPSPGFELAAGYQQAWVVHFPRHAPQLVDPACARGMVTPRAV